MRTIFTRLEEHLADVEKQGYEVVGIFLQGSQNYELDYEGSDIDSKVIVLPSFNDILLNKSPVSNTPVMENNEHVDVKDIRLMFDCFRKQNINFIEILFTKFRIINPKYEVAFQPLLDNKEKIARYNNYAAVNCIAGMCMEKYKAMEHPYPSTMDKIEKFGYDPKQLHHIIRLYEFMYRYICGEPYEKCLVSNNKKHLIDIKKGLFGLQDAREIAKGLSDDLYKIKNKYMAENPVRVDKECDDLLNTAVITMMKKHIMEELNKA